MTPDVISVADTTELAEIAMLLETKRIKRVPVVRDGKLVGIVSRANLVRHWRWRRASRRLMPIMTTEPSAKSCSPS
jgi:CBS-domain-containing membrane protein